MKDSDTKSDDRHNQLVQLSIRPDALKVDRAANPNVATLRFLGSLLLAAEHALLTSPADALKTLLGDNYHLSAIVGGVREVLESPEFEDAKILFDGELADAFGQVKRASQKVYQQIQTFHQVLTGFAFIGGKTNDDLLNELTQEIRVMIQQLERFVVLIDKLGRTYAISQLT